MANIAGKHKCHDPSVTIMKMNGFGCILWNAILITTGTLPLVRAVGGISFHCLQPLKIGPCLGKFQRFFFNTSSLQCEVFAWGGCFGGQNNFETYDSCLRECACDLPKDEGPCFGSSPSWFHEGGTCKQFVWRGCGGNANRFDSRLHCAKLCL
ncbi:PCPI-like protein [Mya arenaria]|uniref:PCPI-like protein n=1 Tax=Mya arenaria TaxID=6604 RepID=A0ABY7EWT0_MYAAR|nr:PCPI-like protein [Mya arenaria]